jgi:integrase
VSVDLKTIDVRRWKTGKETVVYTTKRLRDVLKRRSGERGNTTLFIFAAAEDPTKPRPYRVTAITDVMDRIGLNTGDNVTRWGRATVHSLRHTYASKLLRTGKYDLYRLKDRLGHSSIKSTEIYGHLEVDDDARKASEILDDLEAVR